ncbi:acetyl esterase [Biscogniauxia marginata]|nr:acetyl esterase [Biscogniauxia marginata]
MLQLALLLLLVAAASGGGIPGISRIENLITFGDSYTDEGRLQWFISHNGTAPPPGTVIPTSNATASGGYTWPHFVSQEINATTYNYAVSGAVCSNELISRYLASINGLYPSVIDYEIPAFLADVEYSSSTNSGDKLFRSRRADNTIYTLWIGTNDLGNGGYLRDTQRAGTTISDYVDCVWSTFDGIYGAGGRHFVLFNQAPLDKSPLYAAPQNGGVGDTSYWANKTAYNATEIEQKMLEYTTTVNTVYAYGAPFQLLVRSRWPGASVMIFDVHRLLSDVYEDPSAYLDAPANATGYYYWCPYPRTAGSECEPSEHPLSSFLWYDELHPSPKTDEIIAAEFVNLLSGNSSYGIYYNS